ncbi:hypothetical protein CYMTET_44357 [Cymbomonas tetramitiformis]|uniref:Uncharacterized protein n=1 Tax=Cymbomonas tetramitiformis TaxID=36881 RepID=A0AAE0C0D8_9CHLO|nr:hypothetical protein CYMTET_44357 [Cymbomonas tetramitiformis]
MLDAQDMDVVVFPSVYSFGATDLIKLRCVPVLPLGVTADAKYVDSYVNTPLDFFAHDIQHARRTVQETESYWHRKVHDRTYLTNRTPFAWVSRLQFYKEMNSFTNDVVLPLIVEDKKVDDDTTRRRKRIKKMIVFEVIHEKAWPITRDTLCDAILLGYDVFPIERLVVLEDSGIHYEVDKFNDPTTLSNMKNKLISGFYDDINNPKDFIVHRDMRSAQKISEAALEFLKEMGCDKDKISLSELLDNAEDDVNADEMIQLRQTNAQTMA